MRVPQQKKHTHIQQNHIKLPHTHTHTWRLRPSIVDYYEYHYIQALAPS